MIMIRRIWRPRFYIGVLIAASLAAGSPAIGETCSTERGPARGVVKVIDGETLLLADGSEVRLIGALSPRLLDGAADETSWTPEREA
jgi:hypothetical protein